MSENDHWRSMARLHGIERDGRTLKREAMVRRLQWEGWTPREREVYATAFLFPDPEISTIDHFMIAGVELNLAGYRRTARIIDPDGDLWLVIEGQLPQRYVGPQT